jgi:hypothetical protein
VSIDEGALDRLAEAVHRAHDPIERLASAVNGVFAEASKRDRASQDLHLRLADGVAQGRAIRARAESKYGPIEGMYDRLAARGGMSALWC